VDQGQAVPLLALLCKGGGVGQALHGVMKPTAHRQALKHPAQLTLRAAAGSHTQTHIPSCKHSSGLPLMRRLNTQHDDCWLTYPEQGLHSHHLQTLLLGAMAVLQPCTTTSTEQT
jgi:hypothetical protein